MFEVLNAFLWMFMLIFFPSNLMQGHYPKLATVYFYPGPLQFS